MPLLQNKLTAEFECELLNPMPFFGINKKLLSLAVAFRLTSDNAYQTQYHWKVRYNQNS